MQPDATKRWLDPYHPSMFRRALAAILPALFWAAVAAAMIAAGLEYVGFKRTMVLGLWLVLGSELSGPNPYQFRKRVRRVLELERGSDE